jgi:hypothetical protein
VQKLWITFHKYLKLKDILCRRTNGSVSWNMRKAAYAGKIPDALKPAFASAGRTKILSGCRQKKNPARAPGF